MFNYFLQINKKVIYLKITNNIAVNYPEQLLHYIWKFKLYPSNVFVSSEGNEIEVIDTGMHNSNAGPDFFNAKIKTDNKTWAGNIEIHKSSSDWKKHNHHTDPAYNSVVLHVAEHIDCDVYTQEGRRIPQIKIGIPDNVINNYSNLLASNYMIPCSQKLINIPKIQIGRAHV